MAVTELGQKKSERVHMHGILWTDEKHSEVKMHDFTYTFEEIIAIAEKLKTL